MQFHRVPGLMLKFGNDLNVILKGSCVGGLAPIVSVWKSELEPGGAGGSHRSLEYHIQRALET